MNNLSRKPNTTKNGGPFDLATINAVWNKARVVPGYDPNVYRKDACDTWIMLSEYGNTTEYGWEVDHIQPVACGGSDILGNLQPLQWQNNRHKGDNWPNWACAIRAAA